VIVVGNEYLVSHLHRLGGQVGVASHVYGWRFLSRPSRRNVLMNFPLGEGWRQELVRAKFLVDPYFTCGYCGKRTPMGEQSSICSGPGMIVGCPTCTDGAWEQIAGHVL
jgi:hypothetical protein